MLLSSLNCCFTSLTWPNTHATHTHARMHTDDTFSTHRVRLLSLTLFCPICCRLKPPSSESFDDVYTLPPIAHPGFATRTLTFDYVMCGSPHPSEEVLPLKPCLTHFWREHSRHRQKIKAERLFIHMSSGKLHWGSQSFEKKKKKRSE